MASSIVVQICSQIEPKLVPCCTQSQAVDTIPLGLAEEERVHDLQRREQLPAAEHDDEHGDLRAGAPSSFRGVVMT